MSTESERVARLAAEGERFVPEGTGPKVYVVTCKNKSDWDEIHNYIINENEIDGIPNRKIECTDDCKSCDRMASYEMSDEEAINYLSSLRQIGRWSSEMVLIFFYNRPNIWPVQDIGLLRSISNNYKKKYLPPDRFVKKLKKKFSPFCTLAVMALWYSVDNEPVQY